MNITLVDCVGTCIYGYVLHGEYPTLSDEDFFVMVINLRNEFKFWKVHDPMNIPKIEFITYIYILYYESSINFQFSPYLAGFPEILN